MDSAAPGSPEGMPEVQAGGLEQASEEKRTNGVSPIIIFMQVDKNNPEVAPNQGPIEWVFCLVGKIAKLPIIYTPLPDRFLTKFVTDPVTGCWNWTGAKKVQRYKNRVYSYGAFAVKATHPIVIKSAHRVAYESYFGPIPQGLEPDHVCRNPLCVNPYHIEAVTHQVNCSRRSKSGPYPKRRAK